MIEESAGNNNGTGYAEEKIDSATGTAGVKSAYLGYNPGDGTYVAKEKPKQSYKFETLPTNTGNWLLDKANTMLNDANAYSAMDSNLKQLYSASRFGDSGSWTREGMDNYMLWEYGNSKYDTNSNVRDSEGAKFQRNNEQTNWVVAANGLPRLAVRGVTTIGSFISGMVKGGFDVFGGNEHVDRYFSPEAFTKIGDDFASWMNEAVPVYQTKEQEEASPMSGVTWTSGAHWASMIDNVGFTLGAVGTMYLTRGMGPTATIGMAAFQAAGTAVKALTSEDAKERTTWQNLLPAVTAAAAAAGSKYLPAAWRNQLAQLGTGILSAAGEAEVETQHALKEYKDAKARDLDFNIDEQKRAVREAYADKIAAAGSEAEQQDLQVQMENQLSILDWERTRAMNHATKDIEDAASIVRLGNYAVLIPSNMIQFGKFMTGGWKTFQTSGKLAVNSEIKREAEREASKKVGSTVSGSIARGGANANKQDIINRAILKIAETGQKVYDEATRLTAGEIVYFTLKHPVTEGLEEINQAAVANAAKAYAERNTDDYYGQISGLEAFRRTESAWTAAVKGLASTYGKEEAWSEFMAGAIMGAMGVPMLRSMTFERTTGEMDTDGKLKKVKRWRSPIYFQGGIYNEIKKAAYDKENMGKMAKRLNQVLTKEGKEAFRKKMAYIAHHMQYEQDKEAAGNAIYENKKGDKYRWMNAQDAELVKMVELFQNTGQIGLLKTMIRSHMDFETAADLRSLQEQTSEKDDSGNVMGPYSEFDLTDPGENASEAAKQHLQDEVKRMRDKIKEQVEHDLKVAETYENARRELQMESENGLSDDNMNCLAWYRTRIAMFDERTRDMYAKHKESLETLNDGMDDFVKEIKGQLQATLEEETKKAGGDETKIKEAADIYNKNITVLDAALEEWKERWEKAKTVKDDLAKAKILFTGNKEGDPIGRKPAKKPWYLPNRTWARRVSGKQSEAAFRRRALMGTRLDLLGSDSVEQGGFMDILLSILNSDKDLDLSMLNKFGTVSARKEFAEALDGMRQCQAAIVRYKDLYQFYKDNPWAGAARRAEEENKAAEEVKKEEKGEVKAELNNATKEQAPKQTVNQAQQTAAPINNAQTTTSTEELSKQVSALYDKVVEMLKSGKDPETVTEAIEEMAKEGSRAAKILLANQEYLKVFAQALEKIRVPVDEKADIKPSQIALDILKYLAVEAGRKSIGPEAMHKYIEERIKQITSSAKSLIAFLTESHLTTDSEMESRDFDRKIPVAKYDENGERSGSVEENGEVVKTSKISQISGRLSELLNIVDNLTKKYYWNKANYSKGKEVDEASQRETVNNINSLLSKKQDTETTDLINKISEVGREAQDGVPTDISDILNGGQQQTTQTQQEPQQPQQAQQEQKKKEPASPIKQEQKQGKQSPNESFEEGTATGEDTARERNEHKSEVAREASKPSSNGTDIWIPAVPFFDVAFRKNGETVRMDHVKFENGKAVITDNPAESPYGKFFALLERLGVFSFIDENSRDGKEALQEGEDVYFIMEKVAEGQSKSEILGLTAEETAYKGAPIIWMCVKRGNRYQCIGTLSTDRARLKRLGQDGLYDEMMAAYQDSAGSVIHPKTGKIEGIHPGLVETQGEENNLNNVYGDYTPRLAIAFKGGQAEVSDKYANVDTSSMKSGVVYALVRDNATDKDVVMPCRIAHFNHEDKQRLGSTRSWQDVEGAIKAIADAAAMDDIGSASAAINDAYKALGTLLALDGYGIHIDLATTEDGRRKIVVSKPKYSNGEPIQLRDKSTGAKVYKSDNNGRLIRDDSGELVPIYEREFAEIPVSSAVDVAKVLADTLMSDDFNPPFRVTAKEIADIKGSPSIKQKITDGVITTNIVDNGGLSTKGGYASVFVKDVAGQDSNQSSNNEKSEEERQAAAKGEKAQGQIGERVLRFGDPNFEGVALIRDAGGDLYLENANGKQKISAAGYIEGSNQEETLLSVLNKVFDGEVDYVFLDDLSYELLVNVNDNAVVIKIGQGPLTVKTLSGVDIHKLADKVDAATSLWFWANSALLNNRGSRTFGTAAISEVDKLMEQIIQKYSSEESIAALCEEYHKKIAKNREAVLKELDMLRDSAADMCTENSLAIRSLVDTIIVSHTKMSEQEQAARAAEEQAASDKSKAEEEAKRKREEALRSMARETQQEASAATGATTASAASQPQSQQPRPASAQQEEDEEDEEDGISNEDFNSNHRALLSTVSESDKKKPRIDIDKEVAVLRGIVPYLTRDDALIITERLIEVGKKGLIAQGMFKRGLMTLSRRAVRGTAFHEAFHGIFQTALTDEQRRLMLDDAKKVFGLKMDADAEEALADAFRDYMVDQVYGKSLTRRIADFFRSLFHLTSTSYERLGPSIRNIFYNAMRGEYREAGRAFTPTDLRSERIAEYRRMGYSKSEIDYLEGERGKYSNRPTEVRRMLDEAGISEEAFDILNEKSREELIACL